MSELDRIRNNAAGKSLDEEQLKLFSSHKEETIDIPTRDGSTHVYVYYPKEQETYPVFINLHGGGFVKGHRDQDLVFCRNLCQNAHCMVFDIDYKTAPEHRYPYALHEVYDAVSYIYAHAEKWNLDRKKFVMGGHSAGGNLTLAASFLNEQEKRFELQGILLDYPPVDMVKDPGDKRFGNDPTVRPPITDARMYNDWYVDEKYRKNCTVSPAYATDEELSKLPEVLLITAGHDTLGEEAEQLAYRMIEAGVTIQAKRVMEADHGFVVRRKPGFEVAERLIFQFLRKIYA